MKVSIHIHTNRTFDPYSKPSQPCFHCRSEDSPRVLDVLQLANIDKELRFFSRNPALDKDRLHTLPLWSNVHSLLNYQGNTPWGNRTHR